jgi:hypothetical protein
MCGVGLPIWRLSGTETRLNRRIGPSLGRLAGVRFPSNQTLDHQDAAKLKVIMDEINRILERKSGRPSSRKRGTSSRREIPFEPWVSIHAGRH